MASDSDLVTISEKLRLVSIDEHEQQAESSTQNTELMKSDEELARLLQVLPLPFSGGTSGLFSEVLALDANFEVHIIFI